MHSCTNYSRGKLKPASQRATALILYPHYILFYILKLFVVWVNLGKLVTVSMLNISKHFLEYCVIENLWIFCDLFSLSQEYIFIHVNCALLKQRCDICQQFLIFKSFWLLNFQIKSIILVIRLHIPIQIWKKIGEVSLLNLMKCNYLKFSNMINNLLCFFLSFKLFKQITTLILDDTQLFLLLIKIWEKYFDIR